MNSSNFPIRVYLYYKNESVTRVRLYWNFASSSFDIDKAQKILDEITRDFSELYLVEMWSNLEERDPLLNNVEGIRINTEFSYSEFYKGPPPHGMMYYIGKEKIFLNYPLSTGSVTGNGYIGIFSNKADLLRKLTEVCNSYSSLQDWEVEIIAKGGKIITYFDEKLQIDLSVANSIIDDFPFQIDTKWWETHNKPTFHPLY